MFNRGTKYLHSGNYLKALSFFKKETREFKELYLNMGNCYKLLDNHSKAADYYLLAASDSVCFANGSYGPYPLALNNLGLMCYTLGDDVLAMEMYSTALVIDPLYGEAIWNYGNACLRSSNCVEGWDHYEYRFKRGAGSVRIDTSLPTWDGQSCGDSIVVLTEQGLGDKIMFGRYLHLLRAFFKEVVIVCHESLDCVYSDYKCVRSSIGYKLSIPICSLARIFGVLENRWLDGKFSPSAISGIGVCWNGSATHANNRNRSCSSNYFSALADIDRLYSLSPDCLAAKNITALRPKTWSETCSYLLGLKLVVSVDTSIVHMAGTLGVPCIMIQPLHETDFRWGMPRAVYYGNNPWYASVAVVPNTGWDNSFKTVRKLINETIN